MSELKVEVVEINSIENHPNADKLDLATVKGWACVVQKDRYKAGDKAIYFPIDSILPPEVECKIFGIESKVKLIKSRVRTIKLRGAVSQGLIVPLELFGLQKEKLGADLTKKLGVTKFEPPTAKSPQGKKGIKSVKQTNPNFRKYTSIENFKNYPDLFNESEVVVATEKIHGTNFRAGWVPYHAGSWWRKALKFLRLTPQWEFVFGSHNVQLQNKSFFYKGFYDENVYAQCVETYDLKKRLAYGEVIYGEIYGSGIQKDYHYGCANGERKLVVFDVMLDGVYMPYSKAKSYCIEKGFTTPPVLYCGPFDPEKLHALTSGPSILAPKQEVREGLVVKPVHEQLSYVGRKILKLINNDYLLLQDNTEFH
ncbi:MAG: RNA ligase (ATP) [Acinetobacter sp.]|nr:RNA ligase (ATP) [Acinetobacter sp.]